MSLSRPRGRAHWAAAASVVGLMAAWGGVWFLLLGGGGGASGRPAGVAEALVTAAGLTSAVFGLMCGLPRGRDPGAARPAGAAATPAPPRREPGPFGRRFRVDRTRVSATRLRRPHGRFRCSD